MTSLALLDALRARFGDRFSTAAAILERHGKDEAHHAGVPPDGVVFVETTEEVVEVVNLCAAHALYSHRSKWPHWPRASPNH